MLRLLVASLSLLPVLALAPPSWAGEQADHDDTLMRTSDCASLFEGVDHDDAKDHRDERVLRLVEKNESGRNVVSIEHTVSTWSTPRPLQFGGVLTLVEIVEEADLDDEAEPEAAATTAAAEEAHKEEAQKDAANDIDSTAEAAAPADASAQEAKEDEPGGRAAIFELAQDMGNCRAGRYIVERHDTLGQGGVVLEVLKDAVLVDSGDDLSLVRTTQASQATDVQLVWVSSFELVIDDSAKGLKSSGKKKKKKKKKKRKKKKKKKKKKRSKRR